MYSDITCIILSGGVSSRMGVNKSLLKVGGKTIIEYMQDLAVSLFNKLIISVTDKSGYEFLNVPVCTDIYSAKGPLSGIHSALVHSQTEKNFIIACDMPLMSVEMIKYIVDYPTEKLITIVKTGEFYHPLCGVYSKKIIPFIESRLEKVTDSSKATGDKSQEFKIQNIIFDFDAEIIDAENFCLYNKEHFFNMNDSDEFEYVKKKLLKKNEM